MYLEQGFPAPFLRYAGIGLVLYFSATPFLVSSLKFLCLLRLGSSKYARCANLPGDDVVKAFEGTTIQTLSDIDVKIEQAIQNIKRQNV